MPVFEFHTELSPVDEHDHLVDATAGPNGAMIALWTTAEGADALTARYENSGGASFARSRTERPVSARVVTYAPQVCAVVPVAELRSAFPTVQAFPDGAVLVVGSRCRWSPEGPEHNAAVYGPDGELVQTGVLGDGIAHVAVSASGDIWVGYFDEGVFGNYGWGGPGPEPIGSAGLVRFDRSLRPVWRLDDTDMADCYALNIDGDTAWAYYYTEFPIARIAGGNTTIWDNPAGVGGAKAVAVAEDRVALYGGYGNDGKRLVLGRLDDGRFHVRQTGRLDLPRLRGPRYTGLYGRGETLHLIADQRWYRARPLG